MNKWRIVFWTALALVFVIPPLIPRKPQVAYMEPRYPKDVLTSPDEAGLRQLARIVAHQTSGNVRLGTISSGKKAAIVLPTRRQDMRLLKAVIEAMKERHVQVDYILEDDLLAEVMGVPPSPRGATAAGDGPKTGEVDLYKKLKASEWQLGRWPRYVPAPLREKMRKAAKAAGGGEGGAPATALDPTHDPKVVALREAMRRYVMELHPEYGAIVGGRPRQEYMTQHIGPKYIGLWDYATVRDVQEVTTQSYPTDVWRLSEDKIMEMLPWIEEVHIYDPEGTDVRFSVTAREAEIWAKASYQPNHIFMNPLQGTRALYYRQGLHDVIVPKVNGVVAGTSSGGGGTTGPFPLVKIYLKDGLVTHVEGSGPLKEVWDAYLSNEDLSNAQVPYFPKKGFFWSYEISFGTNPKFTSAYAVTEGTARSGVIHWGFGIEHGNPEIEKYLIEHRLPNDHMDRSTTYFSTYEVKVKGRKEWVKLVDRGRLTLMDDPEVRALASRYGNVDEILQERWVPHIPGINAPGNYVEDYAKDPAAHIARTMQQIQDGTYPYLR